MNDAETLQFLTEVTKNLSLDENVRRKMAGAVAQRYTLLSNSGTSQSFNQQMERNNQCQVNNTYRLQYV